MNQFDPMTGRQKLELALFAAAVLLLPALSRSSYVLHILILAMLFTVFALSVNLVIGFTGLKSFGHQAFFGIGAYGTALLSMKLGLSPWLTIWLAALVAAAVGLLVAIPVLRIKSLAHVSIVTLTFAEIVRIVCANLKGITRGEMGLWGIPPFSPIPLGGGAAIDFGPADKVSFYYLAAALMLAVVCLLQWLTRSRTGVALATIRDAEGAAESLGIGIARHKMLAFFVSAFLVGLAGAFYAHYILLLTPNAALGPDLMIQVLAAVLVGGLGTRWGPVIGTYLLTVGIESMRFLGDYRLLIYGLLIIAVMRFFPRGLAALPLRPLRRAPPASAAGAVLSPPALQERQP